MHKVKIEKGKYAEFFPFSQSEELVLMDFGESLVCCPWGLANVDIAKHNKRVASKERKSPLERLDEAVNGAFGKSECEDKRKKDPKTNEKPKDDKSIKETTNRSARPLKSTENGKSVLDEGERKYLEAFLAPFKNRVKYIVKKHVSFNPSIEWITIKFDNGEAVVLPYFERGKMYKGMDDMREYSPKELGLWKK